MKCNVSCFKINYTGLCDISVKSRAHARIEISTWAFVRHEFAALAGGRRGCFLDKRKFITPSLCTYSFLVSKPTHTIFRHLQRINTCDDSATAHHEMSHVRLPAFFVTNGRRVKITDA